MNKLEVGFNPQQRKFFDELDKIIEHSLDINDAKLKVLKKIGKFLNVDRVLISEFDSVKGIFLQADKYSEYLSSDKVKSLVGTSPELPCNKGPRDYILKEHGIVIIPDSINFFQKQNLSTPELVKFEQEYNIRACIVIPVCHSDQFLGTLVFHFGKILEDLEPYQHDFLKVIADKIRFILLQSSNIIVKCNLSKIIGLSPAITYKALAGRYKKAVHLFEISDKDFCNITIEEIKNSTCLYNNEIKNAIERLNELCLVDIIKNGNPNREFRFRLLDYQNFISREFIEQDIEEIVREIENESYFDDNLLQIQAFISKFEETYGHIESFEYTRAFLNKTMIYDSSIRLNKVIFLTIYRAITTFVENNDLNLDNFGKVIDELFTLLDVQPLQKIVRLDQSFVKLAKRLKLLLFYKLKELSFNELNPDFINILDLFKINDIDSYC